LYYNKFPQKEIIAHSIKRANWNLSLTQTGCW